MADVIAYNGSDKWKQKATDLLNQGGGGGGGNVDDVKVNGTSVVDSDKVAQIDLTPYAETSDLATVATTGDYDDLQNKPTIPAAQVQSDWLEADTSAKSYILNKPTIPSAQVNSDWNASSGVAEILNKPNLATVATSGSYTDLSNKPTDATQSASGLMSSTDKTKLDGIASGAEVNVQSDWSQSDNTADDYIKNKPNLATVATSGSYDDLTDKPTIPAAQVQSDYAQSDSSAVDYIKNKPTIPSTAEDVGAIPATEKGANSGVAELDANGKVPSSQLPSYVDDVIEVANYASLPSTGETGKIYVTVDDNKTYRWSGSAYVEISPSLALGETSSTAYRGDRGKTAYDHATESGRASTTASGLYKIGVTAEGHVASVTAVQKSDITGLGIPGQDTNTTYTLGTSGNNLTLTPSSGSAQSVTAPYATNAGKVNNHTVGMDIPTPQAGDETKYLGGDGTFQEVSPKREASGSVVSFTDGSTYPLSKCEVDIEPQQDLHGYDYPWAGGSGKNKLDTSGIDGTVSGVTYKADANGIVTINGTKYGNAYAPFTNASITLKGGVQYTFSIRLVSGTIRDNTETNLRSLQCYLTSSGGTNIASVSTVNENSKNRSVLISPTEDTTAYVKFAWWSDNTIITNAVIEMQVEEGSTDTAWEPYSNICPISGFTEANVAVTNDLTTPTETHTISIPFYDSSDNPITVYGGTLNVTSGELRVDRVNVDLGTLNWTYSSETNRERFSAQLSGVKWVSDSIPINAICSALVVTDFYAVYNHITDNTIGMWHGTTLAVYSSAYTDATAFKQAMNGVQLVYELATPLTYTLTATQIATLLGNNNIFADTGDIAVKYVKEPFEDFATKGYVDTIAATKQDTLTAGTNMDITSNTISCTLPLSVVNGKVCITYDDGQ